MVLMALFLQPGTRSKDFCCLQALRYKNKGTKTVYQQHLRYIQSKGLQKDPVELFDRDLSKQIKEWQDAGERIVLAMDINGHPLHNNL
jgi:hypothetical protein